MKNEDFKTAIKDFEKSIDKDSNLKDAYFNAGVAYSKINDLQKSVNYYNKVLELDPNDSRAYTNLAYLEVDMNEYDSALIKINKSIKINNKNLNSYLLRGNINKDLKNFDEAMLDFDKVISDSENSNNLSFYYEGLYNKSLLELLLGNYKKAGIYMKVVHIEEHQKFNNLSKKIFIRQLKKSLFK